MEQSTITYENLKIEIPLDINKVTDLKIEQSLNNHGKAYIKALINAENPIDDISRVSLQDNIKIKFKGAEKEEILFSGIITNIEITHKGGVYGVAIEAYTLFAKKYAYPLHVGITEAGTLYRGTVKSSAGLGAILSRDIGDTIRVSLSDDPVQEIECARAVLQSLELRQFGVEIISCPTCGRTNVDLIGLAKQVEERTKHITKPLKIAVMGCAVNGPGEAKEADIGVAGGRGEGLIFKKGEIVRKVKENELLEVFMQELNQIL